MVITSTAHLWGCRPPTVVHLNKRLAAKAGAVLAKPMVGAQVAMMGAMVGTQMAIVGAQVGTW